MHKLYKKMTQFKRAALSSKGMVRKTINKAGKYVVSKAEHFTVCFCEGLHVGWGEFQGLEALY